MNLFPVCKNLLFQQSYLINSVLSRNVQWSCIITGRKKPETLWPNKPKKWPGGQKHFGFTYYPRYPDQVEPSWEPTALFMVTRRKKYKGNPFWLKRILRNLRIEQNKSDIAIVINSETNNEILWKIKHIVEITPITFPDGIPEEKDLDSCRLYPNGELRFRTIPKLDPVKMELTEIFQKSMNRIDKESIQRYTRKQWIDGYATLDNF